MAFSSYHTSRNAKDVLPIMPETKTYCTVCQEVTLHDNGNCVVCKEEERVIIAHLHSEEIHWLRMKRKCLMIVTAVAAILAINWALAQDFSADDLVRTTLQGIVAAIGIWFATSIKSEAAVAKSVRDPSNQPDSTTTYSELEKKGDYKTYLTPPPEKHWDQ